MSEVSNKKKSSKTPVGNGGIRVGIIGGAGYTGGELIRLLIRHPYVSVSLLIVEAMPGNLSTLSTRIY